MITSEFLGELGNNLFQTAALIGLSKHYNIPFQIINNRDCYISIKDRPLEFDLMFDYKFDYYSGPLDNFNLYNSPDTQGKFEFTPIVLEPSQDTIIRGYFQSEKYFSKAKSDIVNKFFKPKNTIIEYINSKYNHILQYKTLAIHVRVGGDRVSLQHSHKNVSLDYYNKAIALILEKDPTIEKYIIFSDNIEYCKTQFGHSEDIIYIEKEPNYIDLFLMSMCSHNIIANSTFSWWASYLNQNPDQVVVAPKSEWFGPSLHHLNTQDLFPKNWLTL